MDKTELFLEVYKKATKKYGKSEYRLASDKWGEPWKTLIVTMMSAQSRDETTIPIAEELFRKYDSLDKLAKAKHDDVLKVFKSLNYNRTKANHVIMAARFVKEKFDGRVPDEIDDLVTIPGVGRKTANLVRWEVYRKPAICVDTHVHRISNVLGIVNTKNADNTEIELRKIAPEKYWGNTNRMFVLWGKDVSGYDKNKMLKHLEQ